MLVLQNNSIHTIQPSAFNSLSNLVKLDLSVNNILHISGNSFAVTNNLTSIDLSHNSLKCIQNTTFVLQEHLHTVILSHSDALHGIPSVLHELRSVRVLDISHVYFNKKMSV